jgi:hypothetical protein
MGRNIEYGGKNGGTNNTSGNEKGVGERFAYNAQL